MNDDTEGRDDPTIHTTPEGEIPLYDDPAPRVPVEGDVDPEATDVATPADVVNVDPTIYTTDEGGITREELDTPTFPATDPAIHTDDVAPDSLP